MPVTGLADMQDQYMLDILRMNLPGNHKVEVVWVEMTRDTVHMFTAKARTTYRDGPQRVPIRYFGSGNTIKEALLELAAKIILEYPMEDDRAIDIDIPLSNIVNTKTFKKWFDTQ